MGRPSPKAPSLGELLTDTLLLSTQQHVEQFLAQTTPSTDASSCEPLEGDIAGDGFFGRVARGIVSHSTQRSKEACLLLLHSCNMVDLLEKSLPLVRSSRVCDHLLIELELHRGRLTQAKQLFERLYGLGIPGEKEAYKLRQLARIHRQLGDSAQVLPRLREWLELFPDDLESGVIWLELAISALDAGARYLPLAEQAIGCAKELLGPIDIISPLESKLFRFQAINLFA